MEFDKLKVIDYVCKGMAILDYFNDAIIGYDIESRRIVYDYPLMVQILCNEHNLTEEDAFEYIDFNIIGLHLTDEEGEPINPIILNRFVYDQPIIEEDPIEEE